MYIKFENMDYIKIEPVQVPTKGEAHYFIVRALSFDVTPTDGIATYWAIFAEQTDEEGNVSAGQMLLEGNLSMSQDVYDGWGEDDTYVIDWALNELNFIKDETI